LRLPSVAAFINENKYVYRYELSRNQINSLIDDIKNNPTNNCWLKYRNVVKTKNSFLRSLFARIFCHLPLKLAYKIIKKDEYDIEIAYLEGFPTRVIAAGESSAKKLAFVHCDVSVQHVLNKIYSSHEQCTNEYNKFHKVCFVSEAAKSGFEKTIGIMENSCVVHNVIDFQSVRDKASENISQEYKTKGMKLIAVGRLSQEKGYDRLVNVLSSLENKYEFELWLLGGGDGLSAMENQIKAQNVSSVKLMGFQKNPYAYMKKADLFICSSYFEGYSTVVAESMVLGLPVLTTDCAGMREILDDGRCGLIVENSEKGIKSGLISLFEDNSIYTEIKKEAEKKSLSLDNRSAVKEYDELFKEILS
jgi:glycosyltransferase involved in cell wall biosynthesis